MALINCTKHGVQGAEFVSPKLQSMILSGESYDGRIHDVSLKFEDLEFPRFITTDELGELGGEQELSNGVIEFDTEQDAERAIGMFLPICMQCLREFMGRTIR